jgi:hypothetical protein
MDNTMNQIIQKTFIYDMPDDYLYQTNNLGKTAEWTYVGPSRLWVFVNKENKLFANRFLTDRDHGGEVPVPPDHFRTCIECELEPLLCTLIYDPHSVDAVDPAMLEQHIDELPDGTTYQRPANPVPDHTYELFEIQYNESTDSFIKPYPWKQPHTTWDVIREVRNQKLQNTDDKDHEYVPDAVRTQWQEYRQKLRELPQLHGAATKDDTPTTDPWKIQFYTAPDSTI